MPALAGEMPYQDVTLEHAIGCKFFGTFDFVSSFNQIAASKAAAEILSFKILPGLTTYNRMPMGHVDSALYFQAQVVESLKELVG